MTQLRHRDWISPLTRHVQKSRYTIRQQTKPDETRFIFGNLAQSLSERQMQKIIAVHYSAVFKLLNILAVIINDGF